MLSPKVRKRIGMKENECLLTPDGLDAVIDLHRNTSGIRDLEQAAEHIAANALYQIEVNHVETVEFDERWYETCSGKASRTPQRAEGDFPALFCKAAGIVLNTFWPERSAGGS